MRIALGVSYSGTAYEGWQSQLSGNTVQDKLELALGKFAAQPIRTLCCGRTDAGVHALGQVAHLDLAKAWDEDTVRDALNAHLRPHPVAIIKAERARDDFDARFSAIKRHYLYRIVNRRAGLTFQRGCAWRVAKPLDSAAMHVAAQGLVGQHDFTTFRNVECQAKSPVKTLDQLDVQRTEDDIQVLASARSFLHSQVRSMVGALALVGEGRWTPADVATALRKRDRAACAPVAPPDGLYLVRVDYS